jgi:phospholipid/cholesterol/gamma-HCH transport system substrate-binding protein
MKSQRHIERTVGIFVFVGILVTCALILHFGKVGDRFRGGYPITIEFSNAGGLIRGSQVLFAGVLVGKVDTIQLKPDGTGVEVNVDLFEKSGIRRDATFLIKQSGLLGDKHIMVSANSHSAPFVTSGEHFRGSDPFDFSDAAGQAAETVRKLNKAIDKLSNEVLDPKTLEHLKTGIRDFSELAGKLESNSDRLNVILTNIQKGQGTVGRLMTDDSLFAELKQLIQNWKVHGILYQEKSEQRYPSPRK